MTKIRGACHRLCNECEIFKITQSNDDEKRRQMAAHLSNILDQGFTPEDIYCDGCLVKGGRLFRICMDCSIRRKELKTYPALANKGAE